jgi:hypothetical protein
MRCLGDVSQTMRVPAFAFRKLRQLGALIGNSNRLSPKIHQLIRPEFDCITEGLGRLLEANLSGPSWVPCTCKDCQRREAEFQTETVSLRENPLCIECQRKGKLKSTTVVDHVIPHKGDPELVWKEPNWQVLCAPCYSRKTANEDGRWE